jgi:hypothetical protein
VHPQNHLPDEDLIDNKILEIVIPETAGNPLA